MRYRYRFLIDSTRVVACLVLFHLFYRQARKRAIAELIERQMMP
jgi:hypothetical protein